MHFGSGGVGTSMHLTGELFKSSAGVDIVHVPFKGSGPVVAAIMGGEIQIIFQNAGLAESQAKTSWTWQAASIAKSSSWGRMLDAG